LGKIKSSDVCKGLQIEKAQMAELRKNALWRAEIRRKEVIRRAVRAREEAES